MSWHDDSLYQLERAVNTFNRRQAATLCNELVQLVETSVELFDAQTAQMVLDILRKKRHFDLILTVGDALLTSGQNPSAIQVQYAQALIEHGHYTAALGILDPLVRASSPESREHAEAVGLRGRTYKQIFVGLGDAPRKKAAVPLLQAIEQYYSVFMEDQAEHYWHGINVVALLCRAQRDGIDVASYPDPNEVAQGIFDRIAAKREPNTWELATVAEACVALGEDEEAVHWIGPYLRSANCDAFEISGLLRQTTELWQLSSDSEPGRTILPVLQGSLLMRDGGGVTLTSSDIREAGAPLKKPFSHGSLEAVLGTETFNEYTWYLRGLERCRAVAKIEGPHGAVGTGFLVRGSDLHPTLGHNLLLLTNSHVVSDEPTTAECLRPQDAIATFEALNSGASSSQTYSLELVWTSPPVELDVTLLRIDPEISNVQFYPFAGALPIVQPNEEYRVYVIGHPNGGALAISLYDNLMLDHLDPRVHYRAPTDKGSSGSPVFTRDWRLLALHHRGGVLPVLHGDGTHPANEGIWIGAIKEKLKEHFG